MGLLAYFVPKFVKAFFEEWDRRKFEEGKYEHAKLEAKFHRVYNELIATQRHFDNIHAELDLKEFKEHVLAIEKLHLKLDEVSEAKRACERYLDRHSSFLKNTKFYNV